MGVKRAVVIASFGDRDQYIVGILKNVRKFWKGDLILITDRRRTALDDCIQLVLEPSELEWRDHPRWGVRNTNVRLAEATLWPAYDSVCCLNDDMRIVHPGWEDGFLLAERLGVCVPLNPRVFVKYNAMGADATEEDRARTASGPVFGPACNVSPLFACSLHDAARRLMEAYLVALRHCMRGTLAFWQASYTSGVTPVYLPEQWCVCASNARYIRDYKKVLQGRAYPIEPIMLHWGQEEVRNAFRGVYDGVD